MRLKLILPTVDLDPPPPPASCPRPGYGGRHVQLHQQVAKPLRDTRLDHATAWRYRCVRCGHTVRVYPRGVSGAHTSARLRGVAVLLYVLGLSYGAVALALDALGVPLSKTAVYYAVRESGCRACAATRSGFRSGGCGSRRWAPI